MYDCCEDCCCCCWWEGFVVGKFGYGLKDEFSFGNVVECEYDVVIGGWNDGLGDWLVRDGVGVVFIYFFSIFFIV